MIPFYNLCDRDTSYFISLLATVWRCLPKQNDLISEFKVKLFNLKFIFNYSFCWCKGQSVELSFCSKEFDFPVWSINWRFVKLVRSDSLVGDTTF